MDSESWILGFGFWSFDLGFWILDFNGNLISESAMFFAVLNFGFWIFLFFLIF